MKELFDEVDAEFRRAASVYAFDLDLPFNQEKRTQFGSLIDKQKFIPINERFRQATDCIGVIEKQTYPFLDRLKKVNVHLNIAYSDSLAIMQRFSNSLREFTDFRMYPVTYPGEQDLSKLDRLVRLESINCVRELRNLMFDNQYDIAEILHKANEERQARNKAKIAAKAYDNQYIQLEETLPVELLDRMKRL
jgi:hypothetical protein